MKSRRFDRGSADDTRRAAKRQGLTPYDRMSFHAYVLPSRFCLLGIMLRMQRGNDTTNLRWLIFFFFFTSLRCSSIESFLPPFFSFQRPIAYFWIALRTRCNVDAGIYLLLVRLQNSTFQFVRNLNINSFHKQIFKRMCSDLLNSEKNKKLWKIRFFQCVVLLQICKIN